MSGDIHPWVTEGLLYYGLITPEQKEEADRRYEEGWTEAFDQAHWWAELAKIAWYTEVPWYRRMWMSSMWWTMDWVKAHRGF